MHRIALERIDTSMKQTWKPGNMLYPLPAVLVSCQNADGNPNALTVAWTGTICTNPAMVYISLRPERHSYAMIEKSGEFVINLTTRSLAFATDFCGVKSGRDVDKFSTLGLTAQPATRIHAPMIVQSPVNIECKVTQTLPLGSHVMFLATVEAVNVEEDLLDEKGALRLEHADLLAYSHGEYYALGDYLGKFGYSIQKRKKKKRG